MRATVVEIHELRALVAALAARVAALEAGCGPRDTQDEALVLALATSTKGLVFTIKALWRHRRVDGALREALEAVDIDSPKQAGKLLRRLVGHPVGGWTIRRLGRSHDGAVWQVQCDSGLSEIERP